MSLLRLLKAREYLITVDHFSIWRRHVAWAMNNGDDLKSHMTQRFSSNMVFMSLLLGSELNILFNSSQITTQMRMHMMNQNYGKIDFWIGMIIIISVVLTLLTLIATFTAWGMVSAISGSNAHCVLRSSIGQYVAQLPTRLLVTAIYSFLLWVVMFLFLLLPGWWSKMLLLVVIGMFVHVVVVFSAFGRLIMHTGAMGSEPIFEEEFEKELLPHGLHTSLLMKATDELSRKTSITRQYRKQSKRVVNGQNSLESLSDTSDFGSIRCTSGPFRNGSWSSAPPLGSHRTPSPFASTSRQSSESSIPMEQSKTGQSDSNLIHGDLDNRFPPSNNSKLPRVRESANEKSSGSETMSSSGSLPPGLPASGPPTVEKETIGGEKWRDVGGTRLPPPRMLNKANHSFTSMRRLSKESLDASSLDGEDSDVSEEKNLNSASEAELSTPSRTHRRKVSFEMFPQAPRTSLVSSTASVEKPKKRGMLERPSLSARKPLAARKADNYNYAKTGQVQEAAGDNRTRPHGKSKGMALQNDIQKEHQHLLDGNGLPPPPSYSAVGKLQNERRSANDVKSKSCNDDSLVGARVTDSLADELT